jgi:hypothetical protein
MRDGSLCYQKIAALLEGLNCAKPGWWAER